MDELQENKVSYTICQISPTFLFKEKTSRPQICTKGHKWDVGVEFIGLALDLSTIEITKGLEKYCFFCLHDLLKANCGLVENV